MNIHLRSILTAGGAAALAGLILSVLLALPLRFGIRTATSPDPVGLILGLLATFPLLMPFLCGGFALLPIGAGLGYAGLASRAQISASIVRGGALAGAFGGLVYGLLSSLISLVMRSGAVAFLQDVESVPAALRTLIGVSVSVGGASFGGLIFGALGSGLWLVWRGRSAANGPVSQNRGPTFILLSGVAALVLSCGLLIACTLLALTSDALYWSNAQRLTANGTNVEAWQAEFEALPPGDATRGEQVFANGTCHACHFVEAGAVGRPFAGRHRYTRGESQAWLFGGAVPVRVAHPAGRLCG